MVEGKVDKLGNSSLYSERTQGYEGAARVVSTTLYSKVWNEMTSTWDESTEEIENVNLCLPFKLVDLQGNHVCVTESVCRAGGFRQVLQCVFQDKTLLQQHSWSLTQELMLLFRTPLAGHGCAFLSNSSVRSREVTFTPVAVSLSILSLISSYETIANCCKGFSYILIFIGVVLILL